MSENASYTALPGQRSGTGSASVLRYLLNDLAQKPTQVPVVQRVQNQLTFA